MFRLVLTITISLLFGCNGFLVMEEPLEETDASVATQVAPPATPAQQSPTTTTGAPMQTTPTTDPVTTDPATTEPPPEDPTDVPDETPEETLPEPGSIVEFVIQQGTGTGAWNTAEDPVVVYVGQVLKLTNLDDRNHRMHASDNAPVPHGGQLVPGQSEEYVVSTPLAIGDSTQTWDHNDGRSAAFWIEAREYPQP